MSASGSGRDAVFELSQGKLHDAILEYVRSSPEYSCVPVDMKFKAAVGPSTASTLNTLGIQTLALWLDDVAVVPDASGPLVVPKARFGAWTQFGVSFTIDTDTMAQNQGGVLKIPLSTFFDTKQLVMAHPDLLTGADVRVVDNGTLALGVDLVGGDAPNVGNWQQFTGDFRGEHDWAASVSRTVLQQFFDQKLAGALHDNQADRSAPYTLDSLVGTWGNPIRVHGHGAAHDPDCGDIHFRLELEVRLSIGTDHHLWLSTQLVDFSVDYWDGAKAVICHGSQKAGIFGALFGIIVTVFGGAESLANREAPAIPPFDGQDLGEIVYDFPIGGTLKATDLQQSDAGLIVVGDFDISVRSQPQLHISQTSLSFLEVPETFCANTSPPRFQQVGASVVEINNIAPDSYLCLCSIELSPDSASGFTMLGTAVPHVQGTIFGSGKRIEGLPDFRSIDAPPLVLPLGYQGDRSAATGQVRILCNDPEHFTATVNLGLVPKGTPIADVQPHLLEVQVPNTVDGRPKSRLEQCDLVGVTGAEANLQESSFTVTNQGNGPLYICNVHLDDPAGVFSVWPQQPAVLLPGQGWSISVAFTPQQVMVDYTGSVTVSTNVGPQVVQLHARVNPEPQRRKQRVPSPGAPSVDINLVADLLGEQLCVPPQTNVCQVRAALFEPVKEPDTVAVGMMGFFPVPPQGQVCMRNPDGVEEVCDFSGDPRRSVIIDYPPPSGEGHGNPCVAEYKGISDDKIGFVHLSLAGRLLGPEKGTVVVDPGVPVQSCDGWVYTGGRAGLQVIDWRDPEKPAVVTVVGKDPVTAVAGGCGIVIAAGPTGLMALDVSNPAHPTAHHLDVAADPIRAVAMDDHLVYAADGKQLFIFERGAGPELRLRFHGEIPGGAHDLGLFRGGFYVLGEGMLNTLSMGKLGDPSLQHSLKLETSKGRLSHFGQDVLVTADSTHAYRIDSGMQLRRIAEYRRPHWSTGFTPDVEHEHLFSIDPAGHLRRWRVEVHRLSREAFADMLKLQYRPRPPSPGVPPRPSHRYPIRGFLSPPVSHSVIRKET